MYATGVDMQYWIRSLIGKLIKNVGIKLNAYSEHMACINIQLKLITCAINFRLAHLHKSLINQTLSIKNFAQPVQRWAKTLRNCKTLRPRPSQKNCKI